MVAYVDRSTEEAFPRRLAAPPDGTVPHPPPPLPLVDGAGARREVGTVERLWLDGQAVCAAGMLRLPSDDPAWARALLGGRTVPAMIEAGFAWPPNEPKPGLQRSWSVIHVILNRASGWPYCHLRLDVAVRP